MITYDEYTGHAAIADVHVYSYDEKNVTALEIETNDMGTDGDGSKTIEGVIANVEFTSGATNNMSELTLISGNGSSTDTATYSKTYTKFANDIGRIAAFKKGAIVTVVVASDGETINSVDPNVAAAAPGTQDGAVLDTVINITSTENQEFTDTNTPSAVLTFVTSQPATITQIKDGEVKCLDFATFKTESEKYYVTYSMSGTSVDFVDTIVVTETARTGADTKAAYDAAKTAISALKKSDLSTVTLDVTADTLTDDDSVEAKLLAKVVTAIQAKSGLGAATVVLDTFEVTEAGGGASDDNAEATDVVSYSVTVTLSGYTRTFGADDITVTNE
jgi:hypothetical protein